MAAVLELCADEMAAGAPPSVRIVVGVMRGLTLLVEQSY
jgi:hypothetical protein